MSDSYEVFEGKTLSDVFKDIYQNSESNKKQIEVLMKDLLKFVVDTPSAVALVPILKEYLDVAVKNDEQLIKMATIVQRVINSSNSEDSLGIKEDEKNQLMEELEKLNTDFKESKNE